MKRSLAVFLGVAVVVCIGFVVFRIQEIGYEAVHAEAADFAANLWRRAVENDWGGAILKFIYVAASIGTIIGVCHQIQFQRKKKKYEASRILEEEEGAESGPSGALPLKPKSPENSIEIYLESLANHLKEQSLRDSFVPLSAEAEEIEKSLIPLELIQSFEHRGKNERTPINLLDAHNTFNRYVLLGDPGSGKTTCLQRLTLDLIDEFKENPGEMPIPVFCPLAGWTDKRLSAIEYIRNCVRERVGPNNVLPEAISDLLESGRLVVIFDGLNEMPRRPSIQQAVKATRKKQGAFGKAEKIVGTADGIASDFSDRNFVNRNTDSREVSLRKLATTQGIKSKFILSCRTYEFSGSVRWTRVHVLPMDDGQIREFLGRHLSKSRRPGIEKVLFSRPSLLDLVRNPFYLTLFSFLADKGIENVENRGEFLSVLFDKLVERERAQNENLTEKDSKKFARTLSRMAFKMIKTDLIGSQIDLNQVGRLDEKSRKLGLGTGLLIERDGSVMFYHQIIQEFFAAMALRERHKICSIRKLFREDKWTEVLVLFHDISKRKAKTLRTIRRRLKQRNGFTLMPFRPPVFLFLIVGSLVLYGFICANLLLDLIGEGGMWLRLFSANPYAVMIFLGAPLFILYFLPAISFDRRAIGNAAHVLAKVSDSTTESGIAGDLVLAFKRVGTMRNRISDALMEMGDRAVPALLNGMNHRNGNVRRGCIETLGTMREQGAVTHLVSILKEGDPRFFGPTVGALSQYQDESCHREIANSLEALSTAQTSGLMLARAGVWTVKVAEAFKTGGSDNLELVDQLSSIVISENASAISRQLAMVALGAYGHPGALPAFRMIAEGDAGPLRQLAIRHISYIRSPEVVEVLMDLLKKSERVIFGDSQARDAVISAIARIRSSEAVPSLVGLLDDDRWWVQEAALSALGFIGDKNSVPEINDRLDELRVKSGREVAQILGRIGGDDALSGLQRLTRDKESATRLVALNYLDLRFPEQAGRLLTDLLLEPEYPEKRTVLGLLANSPPPGDEFRHALLKLQRSPDRRVSKLASRILKRLNLSLEARLDRGRIGAAGRMGSAVGDWLLEKTGWSLFCRLQKEVELAEENPDEIHLRGFKVMEIARTDPEIGRRMQNLSRLFLLAGLALFFLLGVLPVVLYRPMAALGEFYFTHWPWALGIAGAAIIGRLIGLNDHSKSFVRVLEGFVFGVTIVGVIALAFRYIPTLVSGGCVLGYKGFVWVADYAWLYKWYSFALVLVGLASALLPKPNNRLFRAVQITMAVLCIGFAIVAVIGFGLKFWYVTVLLLIVIIILVRLLTTRMKRVQVSADTLKRRAESYQNTYEADLEILSESTARPAVEVEEPEEFVSEHGHAEELEAGSVSAETIERQSEVKPKEASSEPALDPGKDGDGEQE